MVCLLWSCTVTDCGNGLGVPATNKNLQTTGITVVRIANGELSASLRELSGNRIKYFRSGLIPEREVSPACCSALEGWWTFRKWKTARCKFLETVRRFLSEPDKRRHGAKAY
jgi:hypothetical protein